MSPKNYGIPSRLNARFNPPTPTPNPNRFGFNFPIPPPVQPQQQQQMGMVPPQPQEQPFDFAAEYAKINANRPNRLAYQQSVEQGPPEIERSKWARLGAALAAGASGLGGAPADRAAQFGISSYYQPQYRSDERFEKKTKGLEKLAGMEETDIQNQIQNLEAQRRDYYDRENLALKKTDTKRQGDLTDLQMQNIRDEMDRRNLEEYTDPTTGIAFVKNMATGEIKQIGKKTQTPTEKAEAARLEEVAREGVLQPGRERLANIQAATSKYNVDTTTMSREAIAKLKDQQDRDEAADRLRAKAGQMKPGDIGGNVLIDIANEVAAGRLPKDAASYLAEENGVLTAKAGYTGDPKTEAAVNAIITASINRSRSGGVSNAPAAGRSNPASGRGTTSSGRKYEIIK